MNYQNPNQRKFPRRYLLVGALLCGLAAALWVWKRPQAGVAAASGSPKTAPTAVTAEPVLELQADDVFAARSLALTQSLSLNGTVKAVNTAAIKAKVAGELLSLSVREGDFVKAGQLIGQIDPADYSARQKQAQEQVSSAQAQLGIAQKTLENNQALVAQGFISATALDTASKNVAAAQANVQAASANLDVSKKAVNDSKIVAPISGQVAQRWAQTGERVNIEARIVDLVDKRQLELEVQLNAADLGAVRVGQPVRVQLNEKTQLDGKVLRINPSLNASNRNVVVYVSLPARADLAPGMFLSAKLLIDAAPNTTNNSAPSSAGSSTVAVPSSAVRLDKPQPYVQLLQPASPGAKEGVVKHLNVTLIASGEVQDPTATSNDLTTGALVAGAASSYTQLTGLPSGSWVLTSKVGTLREGSKVKLVAAK